MRIKKFVGETLQEATGQMKTDLGSEAVILHSRKVAKGGLLNFRGGEMFEVTGAIDDDVLDPALNTYTRNNDRSSMKRSSVMQATTKSADRPDSTSETLEGLAQVAQRFEQHSPKRASVISSRQDMREMSDLHLLKGEVEDIKMTLREIAGHIKHTNMPAVPDELKRVYVSLIEQDVDATIASDLVQSVYLKLGENAIDDGKAVEHSILEGLASMFKVAAQTSAPKRRTRIVALVGATGVGKTTTIAKLAAQSKLNDGLKVGLISADTYRIGAIEQLHTFAAIADIPMEVVYKPSEMERAIKKFRDKDVVYIDTVGRSHYRKKEVAEVAKFVHAAETDEVHLVLGASTQTRTLLDSIERFGAVKVNRILISKTDEAASFGPLLRVVKEYPVPVSYITTGQSVPDDIVAARPVDLAVMVYRGVIPHA